MRRIQRVRAYHHRSTGGAVPRFSRKVQGSCGARRGRTPRRSCARSRPPTATPPADSTAAAAMKYALLITAVSMPTISRAEREQRRRPTPARRPGAPAPIASSAKPDDPGQRGAGSRAATTPTAAPRAARTRACPGRGGVRGGPTRRPARPTCSRRCVITAARPSSPITRQRARRPARARGWRRRTRKARPSTAAANTMIAMKPSACASCQRS